MMDRYKAAMLVIVASARALVNHDIPGLIAAIDTADAVGPIVDPTLYRDKHAMMAEDREVFEAALPLWRMAQRMPATALASDGASDDE